ncbi:two-component regulator propeller domain-containing protein [Segatella copri]|uniref:hybrid sensor histidine kinase/response regulator transcription factor n=1 Tax=Segatella copri TaxID=165179 RepID=UPI001C461F25|nr:two-component regulator propeller domain-containing protein [Segatella copri]WOZ84702.1 two-component regulator propeller domain-containing protein [Segatella copri]
MKTINQLIITMMICLFSIQAWAQSGKLFNTDNQLSSNFATQVFQDKSGFIWIATRNGLNTYDGYHITVIKKDMSNFLGLNSNYINSIAQDEKEHILLGTNNSLLEFTGSEFLKIPMLDSKGGELATYVKQVYPLKNKDVAVATSGYGIMLKKQDEQKCHAMKGEVEKLKYILKLLEDKRGRLWIITEDGKLYRKETNGRVTSHFSGTEGVGAQDILQDALGNIYLASKNQGVYLLRAGSNAFTRISNIGNLPIENIYISRNNKLYIGCDGLGIYVYDPQTGFLQDNPLFSRLVNLAKSKITSIIEDNQGNIWVSMLQKGVFMQRNIQNDFNYMGFRLGNRNVIGENCVTSLSINQGNQVWVGTDKDGLYLFNIATRSVEGHFLNQNTVLTLCKDQQGRTWVGTYTDGLGYMDAAGSFHPVDLGISKSVGIFDIKQDPQGNIWIATMGEGLFCLQKDGSRRNYKAKYGADNNIKVNSLPNDYLIKMALSKDGSHVYIATSVGLACLDRKRNSWVSTFKGINCLNKNSFSHCVFVDSKDHVWYGTEDGAFCFDFRKGIKPKLYTTANGLTDNCVASITEDYQGNIWLGTIKGLNKLALKSGTITKFYAESGLQSNEFSDASVCTTQDGKTILMGGSGGLNWFQADQVRQHPWQAKVVISGFILNNKMVTPGMKSGSYTITDNWSTLSRDFQLSHEDNTFTLQLSTLTYNDVEQISYVYSINGDAWRTVPAGQNELAFSHMAPGRYKYRIKAICNGYETPVKEFTITIHPAWYASIWAKLFYLLLLIAAIMLYLRHRKHQMEDQLILQQHIHAEEMGEAKIKFFMNISHEIRTPLTLIITPLLSLIKEDKEPHRQGIYEIIRKNSERILHLINQMMDLRKIDKGQMMMRMCQTDMVAFINEEYELFKQQALAKNIDFEYQHDSEELPVWIDRNNFDKVIINILSNAFKFTPTAGHILLSLTHTDHHAYISIKDSGIGIPKDKLETIFQRFYQSPSDPNDRNIGTGIGLDLTRSLVELHYGSISARNNEGEKGSKFEHGSEFIIRIPLGKDHLKPEELIDEEEVKEKQNLELAEVKQLEQEVKETENAEKSESAAITTDMQSKLPASARGNKAEIVIVEDEEDIQDYLKAQLASDFKIRTYPNGKVALNEILKNKPDLIISDVMMPEMDGTTLCTKLKANINTNDVPIILLTAKSREEDQLEGLQTGADAYILKPFNMDILRRTIINLLTMRRTLKNKFTGKESQEEKVEQRKIQTPDDALMQRVMEVINENIGDSDLSVDMIAQKVGISRVHLHRKMKELTNQTPHSFIRNIRLQQAAKLLKDGKQSITDVMYICGFSNSASFSTMFKNLYGCSPREYMQNAIKE